MKGHSAIGPSSAERWTECPGSVALSAACEKPPSNVHAAEGSVAHEIAEQFVTGKIADELELYGLLGTVVEYDGFQVHVTAEMLEAVILYRDVIEADYQALLRAKKPLPLQRHAEKRVQASSVDEELWGTADYLQFIRGHRLIVYDFKFGKKLVHAEKNKQMGSYAVGTMDTIAGDAFDEIELVIVQPRASKSAAGAVRRWVAPREWIASFRAEAKAAVQESRRPDARLKVGSYCYWCPAKLKNCPLHEQARIANAQDDFEVLEQVAALLPPSAGATGHAVQAIIEGMDDLERELLHGEKRAPIWPT